MINIQTIAETIEFIYIFLPLGRKKLLHSERQQHISLKRRWIRIVAFFGKWTHIAVVRVHCYSYWFLHYYYSVFFSLIFIFLRFLRSDLSENALFDRSSPLFTYRSLFPYIVRNNILLLLLYVNPLMRLIKPSSHWLGEASTGEVKGIEKASLDDRDRRDNDDDKVQIRVGRENKKRQVHE